jgi:outer membrane autotransporter protein
VEIQNAGPIDVYAQSTKGGQTAGLFVNGGGEITIHNGGENADQKVLTVRGDTTAKANGALIKGMNGVNGAQSKIVIDGLVDVLADGDVTDGKGANEAVSAVASQIDIGGGSIRAVNGAWAAIRAYGEFVSQNYGIVNVNTVKDADGNVTGAGQNKTVVEGDIVTNGGMGTKGRVSVGLSTADSHWIGNYTDNTGYGVTPGQLGNVNLFMSGGANWTGYSTGTMNVQMTGGSTWNGYNTSDQFVLGLSDGAVWYNTNSSDKDSKVGYLTGGQEGRSAGIVDMTQGSSAVDIAQYSGDTTFIYKHTAGDNYTAAVSGGNVTIGNAAAGSHVTLLTDSDGVLMNDEDSIDSVLNALAQKLYYTAYVTGERNLSGSVKIAEGLTASSAVMQTGDISFSDTDGQGSLKDGSVTPGAQYPDSQTTDTFNKGITGDTHGDKIYLQSGVLKDDVYTFTKNPTRITTSDVNGTADGQNLSAGISASGYDVTVNGTGMSLAMAGTSDDHTMGAGIYAASGRTVHVTADTVDLAPAGTGTSVGILADGAVTITGKATITADSGIRAAGQGSVTISGTSDITAKGLAVQSDSGAQVSLRDGTVQGGLKANGGTITVNKEKDGTKVAMTGNIESTNGGLIDLTLNTSDSFLTGGILHESGNVTLNLSHGALWTDTDEIPLSRMLAVSSSGIFTLNGGDTEADAGYIMKKGTSDLKIDSYAGHTVVLYGHTGDGSSLSDYGAGNTVIEKAQSGSGIILATDSEGVDLTTNESVVKVLDALAGKLYYTNAGADSNLSGKVQITEGLTAASASKQTGGISFNTSDGQGHYAENTLAPGVSGEVVYGPKETAMMRGAKSAMTTSMLAWRANVTDMTERMGDLRYGTEDGIWARTYGGKIKYDAKNTYFSNSFWGAQVGADKKLASGWHVGGALDYTDGDSDYELGGNGNPKLYTLSAYGTQISDDGSYVDIVLKAGRTENDYTVYNDMGHKLEGDYHTWGTGLSAEYGKRFGHESGYIEPQIQMTLSRLNSADYDAVSDYSGGKKMHVSQDGMTSFIGRVGVAAGRMTERGHFYAKASVLHEFAGDTKSTFSAENEPTSSVKQDFKDTWAELSLGGSYRLSPSSMLYADVTKSFGGDYEVQWKMNAGIRFSF